MNCSSLLVFETDIFAKRMPPTAAFFELATPTCQASPAAWESRQVLRYATIQLLGSCTSDRERTRRHYYKTAPVAIDTSSHLCNTAQGSIESGDLLKASSSEVLHFAVLISRTPRPLNRQSPSQAWAYCLLCRRARGLGASILSFRFAGLTSRA